MRAAVRMLCAMIAVVAVSTVQQDLAFAEELARPSSPEARERLSAGTRLYRVREFEKAIEEYKAGVLKEDAPVFHYNLGQCYRQLGKYEEAIWHYQRFLDRAKPLPAKYKTAVEMFMRDMKAELEKQAMTRQPTEPVEGKPDTEVKPVPADEPRIVKVVEPGEPWYADGLGWGLTGTGVVASSVAIYLLLDAKGLEADANLEPSQETQNELRDRAGDRRLAGVIVGVVGVGALVTGIVKLAITQKPRERTVTTGLDFGVSRGGFAVMGRF